MKKLFVMLAMAGLAFASCNKGNDEPEVGPALTYDAVGAKCDYLIKAWVGGGYDVYTLVLADKAIPGSATEPLMEENGNLIMMTMVKSKTSEKDYALPVGSYKVMDTKDFSSSTVLGKLSFAGRTDAQPANLVSGSVKITMEGTNYKIIADVVTATGQSIKATYVGAIKTQETPKSTLRDKDPYEVVLTNLPADAVYAPRFVQGVEADVWEVYVSNGKNGTEGMQFQMFVPCDISSKEKGFPEGEYKLASQFDGNLICTPGQVYTNAQGAAAFASTWYVGKYEGEFRANAVAPARGEGFMKVSRDAEDQSRYTIEFRFRDDFIQYHEFYGKWVGVPTMHNVNDNTQSLPAAAASLKLHTMVPVTSSFSRFAR